VLDLFNEQLAYGDHLTGEQVAVAVAQLVEESVPAALKADFLCHLARKIETPEEIAAFARELRAKSIAPPLDSETRTRVILDVCGTGGDRLNTFNISTTVALVCASAGVTVAKHGNRAVTSQAGSADVLEALGIKIILTPEEAARSLRDHHFAFFFAPHYHPAFRHIAAARKLCAERGQRTIFNFLGPLLNPARPDAQLVGVSRPELCPVLARVLQSLGVRRGMVVSGRVGDASLDELSTLGDNTVAEFYHDRAFAESVLSPSHFPIQPASLADLAGGDSKTNAGIVRRLLRDEDPGPRRDAVLLNAGAALFVAGRSTSVSAGWELAADLLASGKAAAKLEELTAH
jgi:anthranilate phosphoribosyltransferase